MGAIFYAAFGGENRTTGLSPIEKPYNCPAGEEMHSPFGGWRHHLLAPKAGHYKVPLRCELLMKGLLCGSLLSHRSAGKVVP